MTWTTVAKLSSIFWVLGMGAAYVTHTTPDQSMLEAFWGFTTFFFMIAGIVIVPMWKIISEAT